MTHDPNFVTWPWWILAAVVQFLGGGATVACSAIACKPAWGYNLPRVITWSGGILGLSFIANAVATACTGIVTWRGAGVSVMIAIVSSRVFLYLYCRAHKKAQAS